MPSGTLQFIIVNPLTLQYGFRSYGIKYQVSKTGYAHQIGPLNAQILVAGQPALEQTDDTTAKDHHDQETRAFIGMFSQTGDRQRKDTGPEGGAETDPH